MITPEELENLRQLGTCAAANAIERFNVRLRNEGFTDGTIRSLGEKMPPVIGHAVTARVRFSGPPPAGHSYFDRTDWWSYVLTIPEPRVVVIEDRDEQPGVASFLGEIHGNILRALGCAGAITNGAFRDIPKLEELGFALFAGGTAVSHSYAHMVEFGGEVEVGGLKISPGDLLLADRHGVLNVPAEIAAAIPDKARQLAEMEQAVIRFCRSEAFSIEKLRELVRVLG